MSVGSIEGPVIQAGGVVPGGTTCIDPAAGQSCTKSATPRPPSVMLCYNPYISTCRARMVPSRSADVRLMGRTSSMLAGQAPASNANRGSASAPPPWRPAPSGGLRRPSGDSRNARRSASLHPSSASGRSTGPISSGHGTRTPSSQSMASVSRWPMVRSCGTVSAPFPPAMARGVRLAPSVTGGRTETPRRDEMR